MPCAWRESRLNLLICGPWLRDLGIIRTLKVTRTVFDVRVSFQGDEIDALFHEMAQLDTTEWAAGRNEGLRDFGFDDSTFEQFCNDPDRLYSTGYVAPLQQIDGSQAGNLAFALPDMLHDQQNNQSAFDMSQPPWNG